MDTDFDSILTASSLSDPDKDKIRGLMALLAKSSKDMTGDELRRARETAGLSVGQAAQILLISRLHLSDIEGQQHQGIGTALSDKIDEVYGLNAEVRNASRPPA